MIKHPHQTNLPLEGEQMTDPKELFCLGKTYSSCEEVREVFLLKLKTLLKDERFRYQEGFPIGQDRDILAISNPPYFTACPNPWAEDLIKEITRETANGNAKKDKQYEREPFATFVSEGKQAPIYNAHTYHTKVPHRAIMRYILHYTDPGDVILDCFCGTGMTGVAAQLCGNPNEVESLGFKVESQNVVFKQESDSEGKVGWQPFSTIGTRKVILNDLAPIATFIAHNYNRPVDVNRFKNEAETILNEVQKECGWMYETMHSDGSTKGCINHVAWSDVFLCPECTNEIVFWDAAVNKPDGTVSKEFHCQQCNAILTKRKMERSWVTYYDNAINKTLKKAKQVPVLIKYNIGKSSYEKAPDSQDIALIEKIEKSKIPYWFPTDRMTEGREARRNDAIGITNVHHFYTKRNLWILSAIRERCHNDQLLLLFTSHLLNISKLNRYRPNVSFPYNTMSGTLYIASMVCESNVFTAYENKINKFAKAFIPNASPAIIQTASASVMPSVSVDYIFVDPPFGSNLDYSELSFIWESWLRVWTNNKAEAIVSRSQDKGIDEYRGLMAKCFKEAFRVLKPGRWMTVVFSNTKAVVWNGIQTALAEAGFIVANVSALDKQQGSFKAVTTPTAVKQDLVISAYKPNGGFETRFANEASTEEGVWDFVRTHMKYLPVYKRQGESLIPIPERDPRILFDQMVAWFVRKGLPVPISSAEFQLGILQRFIERDGMFFLPEQAIEYDKNKLSAKEYVQSSLFVSDELSAIHWLRVRLKKTPQRYNEIQPDFMPLLSHLVKQERSLLSLDILLEQNFICYDGQTDVPSQIHSYLSTNYKGLRNLPKDDEKLRRRAKDCWYVPDPKKASDLEKLRERALLREFDGYLDLKQKRLKVYRLETVRAGFKKAWQERDYATIISLAKKIDEKVLQEDPKLLMWYDHAVTRVG